MNEKSAQIIDPEKLPTVSTPILSVEVLERIVERVLRKVLSENKDKPDETLINTEEVCKKFKVSRITLTKYHKENKLLPYSKAGKQFTYRICDCIKAFRHRLKET